MAKKKNKTKSSQAGGIQSVASNELSSQQSHVTTETLPERWITDGAWISGLAGTVLILLLAFVYHKAQVFNQGLSIFGFLVTDNRFESALFALILISVVMVVIELFRVWRYFGDRYLNKHPLLKAGDYSAFIKECLWCYAKLVLLLGIVILFYRNAGEYGFDKQHPYYQIWFTFLQGLWPFFLITALPYVLVTRAFRHNEALDKKDYARLVEVCLVNFIAFLPPFKSMRQTFDSDLKKSALGLIVKVFFAPIMTVFFLDQFNTLSNNFDYIFGGLSESIANGTYTHETFNKDLVNIGSSLIFAIDVGLAWCGYIVSSRWVDNQTKSAEPSLLGWIVCLISYPPFRMAPGWFITGPGEKLFLQLPDQAFVTLFASMMLFSYLVYMLPTIWFGVRFSNLTNRGIIRKGPFAIVRHPAYAAKNFGWWCVGFPVVIYTAQYTGYTVALTFTVGLIIQTYIYYLRAITEEKHLSSDPYYVAYCEQVKYRFFPKLI